MVFPHYGQKPEMSTVVATDSLRWERGVTVLVPDFVTFNLVRYTYSNSKVYTSTITIMESKSENNDTVNIFRKKKGLSTHISTSQ